MKIFITGLLLLMLQLDARAADTPIPYLAGVDHIVTCVDAVNRTWVRTFYKVEYDIRDLSFAYTPSYTYWPNVVGGAIIGLVQEDTIYHGGNACGEEKRTQVNQNGNVWSVFAAYHEDHPSLDSFTYLAGGVPPRACLSVATRNAHYPPLKDEPEQCVTLPAGTVSCEATNSVTLDYGSIAITEANGKTIDKDITMTCTEPATATVTLQSGGTSIYLDNGMNVDIKLNSAALGTLALPSGASTIRVTGSLTGTPQAGGPFSGTDVLLFTYN
jgi:hypothetical protein